MRHLAALAVLAASWFGTPAAAPIVWESSDLGETTIIPMRTAPYPHASRAEGFKNGDKLFPRDPHYMDNSVALFIPKGYKPGKLTDLLVYDLLDEDDVMEAMLSKTRIILVNTRKLKHDQTVQWLERWLRAGPLDPKADKNPGP